MSTKYIASNWRLPNEENSNKSDNYGLSFDGSEFINCGSSSALLTTGAFSVSFWMKTTVTANDALVLMDDWSAGNRNWQILHLSSGNVIRFYVFGSPNAFVLANTSINDGNWHHVVCTYEPSTALRIYIDGSLDNSNTTSIPATRNNSAANLRIGKDDFNAYYTGSISEVAVFDYVLSSTQISTLYGSSELGSTSPMALKPQPISYYPLGDNSASNPLTQPNEAVEDASVFDFVSSSSQYIDCGIPSFLNSTSVFTSSLWFNTNDVGTQTTLWANGSSASQLWVISKFEDDLIIYGGTSTKYYRKNNLFSINTWYNLIVVYDGSQANADRFKVYLNGVLLTGATINGTIETITPTFTTNLNIGRIGYAAASYFNGEISNVVFWNSDQSSEISNIYNSGVPATSYTNTPTAWYKLDQSANWEADSSGNWQIPDAVSAYPQSFDFDGGINEGITVPYNTNLEPSTEFTMSCWFKSETSQNSYAYPVYKESSNTAHVAYGFYLQSTTTIATTAIDTGSGVTILQSDNLGNLRDNKWHHLVQTYDGTQMKVYLDGVQSGSAKSATGTVSYSSTYQDLYIGETRHTAPSGYYSFKGKISNVQLFDTTLPATGSNSIETLYNNGVPLTTAIASDNLKLWAKLDNTATFSTNWSIPDASGNGNTGTSSGMTEQNLVNNNVSVLNGESSGMTSANLVLSDLSRSLPYGDGYSFNFDSASSDYIDCGALSQIGSSSSFTINLWAKSDASTGFFTLLGIRQSITDRILVFNSSSTNKLWFAIQNGINDYIETTHSLSTTEWEMITLTYDGSLSAGSRASVYINGSSISVTQPNLPTSVSANMGTRPVYIGYQQDSGSGYFDGKLSNVSIFNEELTSTEVLKLYSNGVPQDLSNFTPAPVAWYPLGSNSFWNGSQWTVRDMSTGGSNDGTGVNLGQDALVGDSPRSSANGVGTNNSIPENLVGTTKWSDNNSWSINMSETARVEDTP